MSNTIQTKKCPQCKQFKSISEFRKNRSTKDGLRTYCKICRPKKEKIYRRTEKWKARQKRYAQSDKGKAANRRGVKKHRKTYKGKVANRAVQKRFRACHPNQIKATNVVNHAIRAGKLPRANTLLCHYCPKPAQEYHHWHGYEKKHWLDVIPVCIKCHRKPSHIN